jgi:2'-5' RNA ligase
MTEKELEVRVFCAIELPADVRARAAARVDFLRRAFASAPVGWERAEKMHLTLKFLGEIPASRIEDLARAVQRAADQTKTFELVVEGVGAFPPRGAARVLWLGVRDEAGELARLQERIEDECAAENFPREQRAFRPHLTLARLRRPNEAAALAALHKRTNFTPAIFQVSEAVIMQSRLQAGGSRYVKLVTCKLKEE